MILAIMLAGARGRGRVKAFFQNLLTMGAFPFFSALRGLIEAAKANVHELQKEQVTLRAQIQQLESDINKSRNALSELNGRMTALESGAQVQNIPARNDAYVGSVEEYILNNFTSGNKLAAVQYYREVTGAGLSESKDAVDRLFDNN